MSKFEQMKSVDVKTVSVDSLTDIRNVNVDTNLSKTERMTAFVRQIGNPYCFRHGEYAVKLSFEPDGSSITDKLASYASSYV